VEQHLKNKIIKKRRYIEEDTERSYASTLHALKYIDVDECLIINHNIFNITVTLSTLWVSRNLGGFSFFTSFKTQNYAVDACH